MGDEPVNELRFKISYRIVYVSDNELGKRAILFQVSYVSFMYFNVGFGLDDSG